MTENINRITNYTTEFFKCFLCGRTFADGDEPWHMFEKRLLENGQSDCPLSAILSSALGKKLEQDTVHSKLLCDECNLILIEYDSIGKRFHQFRMNILSDYNKTAKENGLDPIWFAIGEVEACAQFHSQADDDKAVLRDVKKRIVVDHQENHNYVVGKAQDQYNARIVQEFKTEVATVISSDVQEYENEKESSSYVEVHSGKAEEGEFLNHRLFRTHNQQHFSSTKQYECSKCHKKYSSKKLLSEHMNMHTGKRPYKCMSCNKDFASKYTLSAHLKIHNEFNECDICNKGFSNQNEISDHMDEVHSGGVEEGEFQCETCLRVFLSHRLLRIHKRQHYISPKQHECSECHKKYSSKNLLDEHMNMHTGKRPYKCMSCNKNFASKYTLSAHLKIHTSRSRPYSCDVCGKSYLYLQNLVQHKKVHSGVKSFVCDICQKTFGTLHNLDVHKIVHSGNKHTGEKPFKCDLCPMAFAQRSKLVTHKSATHLNDKTSFKRGRL